MMNGTPDTGNKKITYKMKIDTQDTQKISLRTNWKSIGKDTWNLKFTYKLKIDTQDTTIIYYVEIHNRYTGYPKEELCTPAQPLVKGE